MKDITKLNDLITSVIRYEKDESLVSTALKAFERKFPVMVYQSDSDKIAVLEAAGFTLKPMDANNQVLKCTELEDIYKKLTKIVSSERSIALLVKMREVLSSLLVTS